MSKENKSNFIDIVEKFFGYDGDDLFKAIMGMNLKDIYYMGTPIVTTSIIKDGKVVTKESSACWAGFFLHRSLKNADYTEYVQYKRNTYRPNSMETSAEIGTSEEIFNMLAPDFCAAFLKGLQHFGVEISLDSDEVKLKCPAKIHPATWTLIHNAFRFLTEFPARAAIIVKMHKMGYDLGTSIGSSIPFSGRANGHTPWGIYAQKMDKLSSEESARIIVFSQVLFGNNFAFIRNDHESMYDQSIYFANHLKDKFRSHMAIDIKDMFCGLCKVAPTITSENKWNNSLGKKIQQKSHDSSSN